MIIFLEPDCYSQICAGKRETIKNKLKKKQKWYLIIAIKRKKRHKIYPKENVQEYLFMYDPC